MGAGQCPSWCLTLVLAPNALPEPPLQPEHLPPLLRLLQPTVLAPLNLVIGNLDWGARCQGGKTSAFPLIRLFV